jgi:glycogen(starch) synthase
MTTDTVGGVWCYSLELCRALPSVRFLVACMGPEPTADQRREVAELPNVAFHSAVCKLEWMEDPWLDLERAGEWLLDLELLYQPDLIHLNGYLHASLPWNGPVVVVAHSCVVSWWHSVKGAAPPDAWKRYAREVGKALHSCDVVIAPSGAMAAMVSKHYQVERPRVIYNGRSHRRIGLGISKEPIWMCAARLWDEAKNASCLIGISSGIRWPLILAGDSGIDGISFPNVRMLGHCSREDMDSWFGRTSIYAHPARYEPFGLAPLEAALAGCALVLADIPSLREIWHDAAWFVSPDDPSQWHKTLSRLIDDPVAMNRLALRSSQRARQYSIEKMAGSYYRVYQQLA